MYYLLLDLKFCFGLYKLVGAGLIFMMKYRTPSTKVAWFYGWFLANHIGLFRFQKIWKIWFSGGLQFHLHILQVPKSSKEDASKQYHHFLRLTELKIIGDVRD
ncbi:hypothetical protein L1887_12839 [Cichorium endivia]|nr:hypothetical protein L1887_12839 [Cichorium endivia]